MQQATAEKLNMQVTAFPRAFYGKERHKSLGSGNFVPRNGKKRHTASKLLMVSVVNRYNALSEGLAEIPYSTFKTCLNISGVTICRNLKELTSNDELMKRIAQSKYEIQADFSGAKNFVPIYHFLLTEEVDLGGKVKYLTKNAVLLLCEMIAFYLNDENKGKWYIGGQRRVANAMNLPDGTARDTVNELAETKAIYIKSMAVDSAGNEIIKNGKGNSCKQLTVYEVNKKILLLCKKIQKRIAEQRAIKKVYQSQENATKSKGAPKNRKRTDSTRWILANSSVTESELSARQFAALEEQFCADETYRTLKKRYIDVKAEFLKELRLLNYERADELEYEQNGILEELKEYLQNSGAPPGALPKDLSAYIK